MWNEKRAPMYNTNMPAWLMVNTKKDHLMSVTSLLLLNNKISELQTC